MLHPRQRNRAYHVLAIILRPILRLITKRTWRGMENLPQSGGFIAAANHITNLDPLTFAHFLYNAGYEPKIMAKSSLWKIPVVGWVLTKTGQIPVDRGTAGAGSSLVVAATRLSEGECVAIFPEGTLTKEPDMWPMKGKTGVARLALQSRAPVIPIAQWGAQNILGRYSKVPRPFPRKQVTVVAGPPVDLSDLYDQPLSTTVLNEATERIMAVITAELEDIRGERAPQTRFDPRGQK